MIAYFILVHRYPEQFKRLFRAIYRADNYYAVHVDRRSGKELNAEIKTFLADYPNTILLESQNAVWGGFSLVHIELRAIEALLKLSDRWQFFINLSGQDFPLKSQVKINEFLSNNIGKDFLQVLDQLAVRPRTMNRLDYYVFEFAHRVIRTPFKRSYLSGVKPYIGNQWGILSRRFCEFLDRSPEVNRFVRFYRHTFIADESFFQTVIMNTSYKGDIVNDDMRAIDWVPDGLIKLRPRTFTMADAEHLKASKKLFARKFDANVDEKIIDFLERNLDRK